MEAQPLGLIARIVLAVMADRRLRGPVFALSRLFRPLARLIAGQSQVGFQMAMLAATRMPLDQRATDHSAPSIDARPHPVHTEVDSAPVVVFRGCIMEGLFGHVNAATERTLRANGLVPVAVPSQGCCGALHAHAGLHDQAVTLARRNVRAFMNHPDAIVVVNSAGCGAAMKDYGRLLESDELQDDARQFAARVKDVTEVLSDVRRMTNRLSPIICHPVARWKSRVGLVCVEPLNLQLRILSCFCSASLSRRDLGK